MLISSSSGVHTAQPQHTTQTAQLMRGVMSSEVGDEIAKRRPRSPSRGRPSCGSRA